MKKFIAGLVFMFPLLFASFVSANEAKLGSVDLQKVILYSDAGKAAKDQLAQKASKIDAEKNAREEELKNLKADLEKQSVLLSEPARNAKEKEYQQKLKEYQRFLKDAQDDIQAKNDELTARIIDEVYKVIRDYGTKNKYTMILLKNDQIVLYQDSSVDLTDEILKAYNAAKKK